MLLVFATYGALALFVLVLKLFPGWWLSEHLYSSWGPRTDTRCMRRRELLAAGVHFLLLGAFCIGIALAIAAIADALGIDLTNAPSVYAAFFMSFILGTTGLAGGLYLLLCGAFRRATYVLPPDCFRRAQAEGSATAPVPVRPPLAPRPEPAVDST